MEMQSFIFSQFITLKVFPWQDVAQVLIQITKLMEHTKHLQVELVINQQCCDIKSRFLLSKQQ